MFRLTLSQKTAILGTHFDGTDFRPKMTNMAREITTLNRRRSTIKVGYE